MKPALYTFIIISALIHFAILSTQNESIFIIGENHEQGGSFLNIELSSKKTEADISLKNKVTDTYTTKNKKAKITNKILDKKIIDTSNTQTADTHHLSDNIPDQTTHGFITSNIKQ